MIEALNLKRSPHCMGWVEGPEPGPVLVAVGGVHGNEPAGVEALKRVLDRLGERPSRFRGALVALKGNPEALREKRRFILRDLNRMWTPDRVRVLQRLETPASLEHEERAQWELLQLLQRILQSCGEDVSLVDLHTTSASGSPFCIINDRLENRNFVSRFPLPLVLGLEEELAGTLADFFDRNRRVSVGFEGGRHDSPLAVDRLEAVLWIALATAGNLRRRDWPQVARSRRRLDQASRGLPAVVEVRHRHPVNPGDRFRMEPGFHNFQEVSSGRVLARDRRGELKAPCKVRLLMPLYQEAGEDGYFLVSKVRPFWLRVSTWMRRAAPERLLASLPGVKSYPLEEGALVVDTRVARWLALPLFHLVGFRRHFSRDGLLLVRRRE